MKCPRAILLILVCGRVLGGSVEYKVTDPSGMPIPAKLTFMTEGGGAAAGLLIATNIPFWASRGAVVYTLPGDTPIPVPGGKYRVYVSHGPEWTIAVIPLEVKAEGVTALAATLEHVVDTRGYLSGDMHLHTLTFSGHGDTNAEERIITLCAENVEWAVATDHNHQTDYRPYVKKVGAERWIKTTVGNEVSTTLIGHFNAYPLDPTADPVNATVSDPRELFRRLRGEGAEIIQINHPRWTGARGAYFRDVDLSPHTGSAANRLFSYDFDALEVLNDNPLSGWIYRPTVGAGDDPAFEWSVREDWYNLLNRGFTFTAVGNSDSHHVDKVIGGYPRNFIKCSSDDPAAAEEKELLSSVKAGTVSVSTGIFVEASLGKSLPGSTVRMEGGEVALQIRVQAAPWIRVDRLVVVANGEEVSSMALSAPPGHRALVYEGTYRDRPLRDTWYVVYAIGDEAPVPVVHQETFPLGFTNAFRVDADGDGKFTTLRQYARLVVEEAIRSGAGAPALHKETPSFRRQAIGALEELASRELSAGGHGSTSGSVEAVVSILTELVHDPQRSVRRGAAAALASRPERSALLALLDARDAAVDPEERIPLDFELVRAGYLEALDEIARAYPKEGGIRRFTIRRALLDLARKVDLRDWEVAGPYPAKSWEEGLSKAFPPEILAANGGGSTAVASGEKGGAAWRPSTPDKKSYLNLRDTMDPREYVVAYAKIRLEARAELRSYLLCGSEDALAIFLNGREVFRQRPQKDGEAAGAMVPVSFLRGENEVLVKCAVEKGTWGFYLQALEPIRQLSPGGGPGEEE
jgi:hypothetical protein